MQCACIYGESKYNGWQDIFKVEVNTWSMLL